MLAKAGDAANWTVGRASSGFLKLGADQPAARDKYKTRWPVLHNVTVYATKIANSVIAWSTSEENILPQVDIDLLRRELPN